jgi:hypothetical protein
MTYDSIERLPTLGHRATEDGRAPGAVLKVFDFGVLNLP